MTHRRPLACVLALLMGAALGPAWAERYENGYFAFERPQGWKCNREDTEIVCEPQLPKGQPADAIMIITAKISGPQDTLAAYQDHLAHDPTATGSGTIFIPPKIVTINGTLWVDATLYGSELRDYFTRYLATSRDGIAVLFTFSAHRSRYEALVGAALQAVYTLELKKNWRDAVPRQ